MVHCLTTGCSNTYTNAKGRVTFPKLPQDDNHKQRWLAKIKREGKLPKPGNCFVLIPIILPPTTTSEIFRYLIFYFIFFFIYFAFSWNIRCGILCLFRQSRFYCFVILVDEAGEIPGTSWSSSCIISTYVFLFRCPRCDASGILCLRYANSMLADLHKIHII